MSAVPMMSQMLHCRVRRNTIEKQRNSTDEEPLALRSMSRSSSTDESTPPSPSIAPIRPINFISTSFKSDRINSNLAA